MAWHEYAVSASPIWFQFVYHRWINPPPKPPRAKEVEIPQVDEGSAVPLIFGRVRVRQPVLAMIRADVSTGGSGDTAGGQDDVDYYGIQALYILGIGFENGRNRIFRMWAGESEILNRFNNWFLSQLTGEHNGTQYALNNAGSTTPWAPTDVSRYEIDDHASGVTVGGFIEFFNGATNQTLVEDLVPATYTSYFGFVATDAGQPPWSTGWPTGDGDVVAENLPGFRGYLAVGLAGPESANGFWRIGRTATVQSYSFECASYANDAERIAPRVPSNSLLTFYEENPVQVLWSIITDQVGKLGLDPSILDLSSFQSAGNVLLAEYNGYSRCVEGGVREASEIIIEILRQIDAAMYQDPSTGKIKIRLIRQDYNPNSVPVITPDNCESLEDYAVGGWTGIPNKVRVVYQDRFRDYAESSETAQNIAAALAQDGRAEELVLSHPGVCSPINATTIAGRELAASSRPIAKCRAIVSRSFYSTVPGDVVALDWPEYNISGKIFRVANVDRGTLHQGKIALDLIEEYFYVQRSGSTNPGPNVPAFPPGEFSPEA